MKWQNDDVLVVRALRDQLESYVGLGGQINQLNKELQGVNEELKTTPGEIQLK